MAYKVKKCCCCVSISTGAKVIGALHAIGLLIGLMTMNPIKVAMEFFTGSTFVYMIYRDGEQSRLLFFSAFTVYVTILGLIELYFVVKPAENEEKLLVKNYCVAIETAYGGFNGTEYASLTDCKQQVKKTVVK